MANLSTETAPPSNTLPPATSESNSLPAEPATSESNTLPAEVATSEPNTLPTELATSESNTLPAEPPLIPDSPAIQTNNNETQFLLVLESIKKLANCLRISEDHAAFLLVSYEWDENKFNSAFILSPAYVDFSDDLATNPELDTILIRCRLCDVMSPCQDLGCGHCVCTPCIKEYIESKVLNGDLNQFCPYTPCGKYLSYSLIWELISQEAKTKLEFSLIELMNRKRIEKSRLDQENDSIISSSIANILNKGKELGRAIGENKFFAIALLGTCYKISLIWTTWRQFISERKVNKLNDLRKAAMPLRDI